MNKPKKITIHISEELLKAAQKSSGEGITETIRQGLTLIAAKQAYEQLRQLKGKLKFSTDLKKLREDR